MVIDISVLLAIFFKERFYEWAIEKMNTHAKELRMSTVNLTETLIHLEDKQPQLFHELEDELLCGIRFISPDIKQAKIAANARLKYPFNLGDCFVYALAIEEGCSILTLDNDFKVVDVPIVMPI